MTTPALSFVELQRALESIAPKGVAIAVSDPSRADTEVWPEEAAAIANARITRRREFAAGRNAARRAMQDLGMRAQALPAGVDRAPVWPDILTGSISHDADVCIAVLGTRQRFNAIGVDVEPDAPLDGPLISEVCTAEELDWLAGHSNAERGLWARRIFSAKEAVFKAQFPLTGAMFGFERLAISFENNRQCFQARFCQKTAHIPANSVLTGQQITSQGQVVSLVTIGAQVGMANADFHLCATG